MYSCVTNVSVFNDSIDHIIEHGWQFVEEKLEVQWEDNSVMSSFVGNGSKAGCKHCFRLVYRVR